MKIRFIISFIAATFLLAGGLRGQEVGIKTNLLYWGTTTPNSGVEVKTGVRTTLDLVGTYNPFTFHNNMKLKNWTFQPEFRLWNCEAFNRGFWGFHLTGGQFNAGNLNLPLGVFPKLDDHRFEGYMAGGGVSYGYQWYLGPHWNLEATFGFGYLYLNYDQYECAKCGEMLGHGTKHYFGPTRIGVSFIYLFRSKK
ncbi:MAG: DUF3575 domain-containing protein [Alistipes sp.]|nr:DUF3575 domain-containing protein [Alistipes sp.]